MDKNLNILLVRTDKLGDVILTTPAIAALREKYPGARITFLTSAYSKAVLENNSNLDEIIVEQGFFATLRELRRRKFNVALVFFVTRSAALLTLLAGIPVRIGLASKIWSLFLNKRVIQHRSRVKKHEADYNLDLAGELGALTAPRDTQLTLTPAETAASATVLAALGLKPEDQIIALHPGSGGSAQNWPKEHFAALAAVLAEEYPVKILLTGSPAETPLLEAIAGLMPSPPFILRQAVTLRCFAGLIARCKMFVTNSTGPLHIASALRVPTLSFFPPIKACSYLRWGPYGGGLNKILAPQGPDCRRCEKERCARYSCMREITAAAAYKEAQALLAAMGITPRAAGAAARP